MKKPLKNQSLFNRVAKHLLKQNEKSQNTDVCLYRKKSKGKVLMCAVGCLISNEVYSKNLEGKLTDNDIIRDALIQSHVPLDKNRMKLLSDLQNCHDNCEISEWKKDLKSIGVKYHLDTSILEKF